MIYPDFEELYTDDLILRKLEASDAEDFFVFASDEEVSKYMLWEPHICIEESSKSIDISCRKYGEGKYYRFGIALRETNKLIGIIQLLGFDRLLSSCSFAYMINKEYWGRGYATEALNAILTFAFEKMEMKKVAASHFSENQASGAVMRKCGMIYEGRTKDAYEKNGDFYDADRYVITSEIWNKRFVKLSVDEDIEKLFGIKG